MTAKLQSYDVCEAAHILGISRSTLYLLIRDREIKPVKIRRRTRFREAELERYLVRRERQCAGRNQ